MLFETLKHKLYIVKLLNIQLRRLLKMLKHKLYIQYETSYPE